MNGEFAARNKMDNRVASKAHQAPSLYGPDGGRKYLNRFEREKVLAAGGTLPARKALFVLTLAWTGARVSEVLGLRASSFQRERGLVAISTLKRRRHHMREVPIPWELMEALTEHFHWDSEDGSSVGDARLWPWHRATAWRLVKSVMQRAGVAGRPASPRGMRHGFGVGTLQAGAPLNLVQRWLGHARLTTTAIYAEASGPEERAFAQRFWRAQASGDPPTS